MVLNLNLSTQIIALITISLLHFMFKSDRKILLMRERVFFIALNMATAEVILDILHVVFINMSSILPKEFIQLVCRFYLLSIVLFASCILLYTLSEVYQGMLFTKKKRYLYVIPDAIAFVAIFNLPMSIRLEKEAVGVSGPAVYGSALLGMIYMVISFYTIIYNKEKVDSIRRISVDLSCTILIVTVLFQFLFPRLLIISIGIAVCLVYMYFCLEPPGEYIDGVLGVFNNEAYNLYLKNRCTNNAPVSLLYIRIPNYSNMQEGIGTAMRACFLKGLCNYLLSYRIAKTFYIGNGEIIMAFEKNDFFTNNIHQIRKRLGETFNVAEKPGDIVEIEVNSILIAFPSERMSDNLTVENVKGTLDYFASKYRMSDTDVFLCIDKKEIREKVKYDYAAKSLKNAIAQNRVDVHYQCIYSLEKDCTVSLEALMRITDEQGNILPNDMIIDYAERTGMIRELGNVVLKKVCSFIRTHSLYELEIYTISVNLSVLQCQDSHMAADFIDIMESYQLPASMFRFEISGVLTTYTSLNLKKNMDRLSEMGAQFIIDDYGQGHANVEKIIQMKLPYVKLGPATVKKYFSDARVRNALRTDAKLMRLMNISLMAAGVENQQQFTELKKLGIEYMQGYAFYRPMDGRTALMAITRERDKGLEREALYERTL